MKWELLAKKLKIQGALLKQLMAKYDDAVTSTGPLKPKLEDKKQREEDKQKEIEFKEKVRGEQSHADNAKEKLKEYLTRKDPFPPKKRDENEHIITAKDAEELKAEATKEREAEEAEMESIEEEAMAEEQAAGEDSGEKTPPKPTNKKEEKPEKKKKIDTEKEVEKAVRFLGEDRNKWFNILNDINKQEEEEESEGSEETNESSNFEPGEYVFVSGDGDGIGSQVEQKVQANDLIGALEQSHTIMRGQAFLKKAFEEIDGMMLLAGGDDNLAVIESKNLDKVEEIRRGYNRATGFTMTFGVGNDFRDAVNALVYGKLTGKDKLVHWTEDLRDELRELAKPQTQEEKMREAGLLGTDDEDKAKKTKHEGHGLCKNCKFWTGPEHETCVLHGKKIKITGDMTCKYFKKGEPHPELAGSEKAEVTPEESNLHVEEE